MQNEPCKPGRAVYSRPELRVFGDVATLTRGTGSKGTSDSGMGKTR